MNNMNEVLKSSLDEQIQESLESLSMLKEGSAERKSAIDDIVKLYRLHLEETKLENEALDKCKKHCIEKESLKEQTRDRYFRIGLEIVLGLSQLIFCAIYLNKGFRFEETGSFTSTTTRKCLGWVKPTRK